MNRHPAALLAAIAMLLATSLVVAVSKNTYSAGHISTSNQKEQPPSASSRRATTEEHHMAIYHTFSESAKRLRSLLQSSAGNKDPYSIPMPTSSSSGWLTQPVTSGKCCLGTSLPAGMNFVSLVEGSSGIQLFKGLEKLGCPNLTPADVEGWDTEESTRPLWYDKQTAEACKNAVEFLPKATPYVVQALRFPGIAGKKMAMCTCIRACDHVYTFGFSGIVVPFTVGPFECTLSPTSFTYDQTRSATITSAASLFNVSNYVRRELAVDKLFYTQEMLSHVIVKAEFSASIGLTKRVSMGIEGYGSLGLDLDPANNGFGGRDVGLMFNLGASPVMVISGCPGQKSKSTKPSKPPSQLPAGRQVSASTGASDNNGDCPLPDLLKMTFGEISATLYTKVVNDEDFTAALGLEAKLSLKSVLNSIIVNDKPVGETIAAVVTGFMEVSMQGNVTATVTPKVWGAMVYGKFNFRLGLTREARKGIDNAFAGCKLLKDCMNLVPMLPLIYQGVQMNIDGGVVVQGDYQGAWSLALIDRGQVKRIPVCVNDNHAMCGPDAACWGFICVPKSEQGGFCTYDVHCKSNRCGDEKAALWCVDCTEDWHCPNNQFCEGNPTKTRTYLTCVNKLPDKAPCDRDNACKIGTCANKPTGACGTPCQGDTACPNHQFCELTNPLVGCGKNCCRDRLPLGSDCDGRGRSCASNRCLGPDTLKKCGNCDSDKDCARGYYCEKNPLRGDRYQCLRGKPDGDPCAALHDRACASGICGGTVAPWCGKRNNGQACSRDIECWSGSRCVLGLCQTCAGSGTVCAANSACCSDNCSYRFPFWFCV